MRILEKMYNLEVGTIIDRPHKGDIIKLTSGYNNGHYDYIEMDVDENENLIETNIVGVVTPSDLIGGEIA